MIVKHVCMYFYACMYVYICSHICMSYDYQTCLGVMFVHKLHALVLSCIYDMKAHQVHALVLSSVYDLHMI